MAQMVKNSPTMQDTWFWSLGWEDPQEKETAAHSSILAWRIPWTEEPGRPLSQKDRHDWATFTFTTIVDEYSLQWYLTLQEKEKEREMFYY